MIWMDFLPLMMFGAMFVLLFSCHPVAFVLGGVAMGFAGIGMSAGQFHPAEFFNIVARIYGGVMQNYVLVAIPMFIFMGALLDKSGIGDDLLSAFSHLLRKVPGGLGLSVTLLGTIMAATTGIVGASVVMLTLLATPAMLSRGYAQSYTMGIIGAAGTLGILIPPSIMLVLMADILQISAGKLFLSAVMPGLILAGFYAVYSVGIAVVRPEMAPRPSVTDTEAFPIGRLMASLLPVLTIVSLVLGSIATGLTSTTEAAGIGAFGALALVILRRRMNGAVWRTTLSSSGQINGMLFMIFFGAAAFSYVFRALGGDFMVEDLLLAGDRSAWKVLFFMLLGAFVLGFFFEWIEICLILLPIYVPIIGQLDFGEHVGRSDVALWMGALFAVNLQTSFLTPPFGISLFYMRGVAPEGVSLRAIYIGVIPFVLIQLCVLGGLVAFPQIALWLPHVLLD
jgi:tripartite ATP-independent transporter DctM subunit